MLKARLDKVDLLAWLKRAEHNEPPLASGDFTGGSEKNQKKENTEWRIDLGHGGAHL